MKLCRLLSTLCLLPLALLSRGDESVPPATQPPGQPPAGAAPVPSPTAEVSGKAVVIVDINGKRTMREVDLKDGTSQLVTTSATSAPEAAGPVTWLGVAGDTLAPELAAQLPLENGGGLLVRHVVPESPAAKAGLKENDVLTKVDDQLLLTPEQLRLLIRLHKAGETVSLSYYRQGKLASAPAVLDSHVMTEADSPNPQVLELGGGNLNVADLLKSLGQQKSHLLHQEVVIGKDGRVELLDGGLSPRVAEALKKALEEYKSNGSNAGVRKLLDALQIQQEPKEPVQR